MDAFENEAHVPVDNTIAIQETYINDAKYHTNQHTESSKKIGPSKVGIL